MSLRLTLDPAALALLFPPGSEAEIQLRTAVIKEFMKRCAAMDVEGWRKQVRQAGEEAYREALGEIGLQVDFKGRMSVTASIKAAMRDHANSAVAEVLKANMAELIDLSPTRLAAMRDELMAEVKQRQLEQIAPGSQPALTADEVAFVRRMRQSFK